jgi:hypothetical protein
MAIDRLEQSKQTSIARHWLSKRHVTTVTFTYTTIEELLEVMFSVWSMPRLYNEAQLPLRDSLELMVSECSLQAARMRGVALVRRL